MKLKEIGIRALTVTDMPVGRIRVSPWAVSHLLLKEGIDVLMHYTRTNRSIIRHESDLLALDVLGIKNLLVLSGDDPKDGDYPSSSKIEDLSIDELIKLIKLLNEGTDLADNKLNGRTDFFTGAALNPYAKDINREIEKAKTKIDAGVDFFVTQPIFDTERFKRFLDKFLPEKPLVVSIATFKNTKQFFKFVDVPGIEVPEDYVKIVSERIDDEYTRNYSIERAIKNLSEIKDIISGVYIVGIVKDLEAIQRIKEVID
jgi:5,10-methylenetetrahydrofolate reductase